MNVSPGLSTNFWTNMTPTILLPMAIAIPCLLGIDVASPVSAPIASDSNVSNDRCYFPLPLQGIFDRAGIVMQRQIPILHGGSYSADEIPFKLEKFVITRSAISNWGTCYDQPAPNTYILRSHKSVEGAGDCFRCVSLVLLVPNVIQSLQSDGRATI